MRHANVCVINYLTNYNKMKSNLLFGLLTLFLSNVVLGQSSISGTVTDEQDVPIPGVNVIIKGTVTGTSTDFDGNYSITTTSSADVLSFTYIGYKEQNITVGNQTTINVVMLEDAAELDEVVVVGYGVQKKSDVTGAVASVDEEFLQERPQVNIQQALQGALPGVNITVNSNTASGGNNNFNIRGRRSISGDSSPLIVLDGIIFGGSLTEINVNDIQSLEVLKDASSSAIYGARGANGVILITTKKGKPGDKPAIAVTSTYGIDSPYELPDLMDGATFFRRKVERFGEDFITDTERQVFESGEFPDYVELILRDGQASEHNVSISGGSETNRYFVSANLQDIEGVAINDNFRRLNMRTNLELNVTDWLKIGTNTLLGFADRDGIAGSFANAFFLNPLSIPFDENGVPSINPWPEDVFFANPLENTLYQNNDDTVSLVTNNYLNIDFPFIKGLSYRLNTGYTSRVRKEQTFRGRDSRSGSQLNGFARLRDTDFEDWLIENVVNYQRSFGKHNLFLTALYSAQETTNEIDQLEGSGFPNDVRTFFQLGNANILNAEAPVIDNEIQPLFAQSTTVSQMLRVNYGYDSKYLLTLTARRDGFSAFGNANKFGIFPSAALAWNLHKESFLKESNVLDNLKLRLSWGQNGNNAIDPFSSLPALRGQDFVDADGNNLVGFLPDVLGNPNLEWETTTSFNVGVDFGLFNSRINGSIDVFTSRTEDLLLTRAIPAINGNTEILQNIGETKGSGVEIALNTVNVASNNFQWDSSFSFTRSLNEIVDLGLRDAEGNIIDDVGSQFFIGEPVDVNFGFVFDGIWQLDEVEGVNLADFGAAEAGDVKYRDLNNDGIIDENDRTVIGSLQPDFTLGINNRMQFNNFSFDFSLFWLEGVTKNNSLITTNDFNLRRRVFNVNYWSPENPTNDFPANADRPTNSLGARFYEDASFVRLRDATFSYRFPQNVLDKIGMTNLEVFANGRNLITITDWRGVDPELESQTDRPFSRTYSLGFRVGF